jgi:hypothetical protein
LALSVARTGPVVTDAEPPAGVLVLGDVVVGGLAAVVVLGGLAAVVAAVALCVLADEWWLDPPQPASASPRMTRPAWVI